MRHSRRSVAALVVVLVVFALVGAETRGAIPGADNPKAYTHHDHVKGKCEFDRRTLAGVYKAMGKRDAKWDAAAEKFLETMAVYFSYGFADPLYRGKMEMPTHEGALAEAKAAVDAGCDDPLVLYCRAAVMDDSGQHVQAAPLIEEALAKMTERKYPAYRMLGAAKRLARIYTGSVSPDRQAKYERVAWESAIATMSGKVDARDVRYLWEAVDDVFRAAPVAGKLEFCKAVEGSKDADPWVVNLLYGIYEVKAAWEARGSGWANTVTPEGWKGFYAHLGKARDHLAKAQQIHPEFPEAATQMIAVAMGAGGGELNEKTRDWFDKGVTAQLDYFPAYSDYVYSLYPRWGGSHQEMFRFGVECMLTERYDTYVPYRLMVVLETINADRGEDFSVFKIPEVKVAARTVLNKMADKFDAGREKDWHRSYLAAIAWRNGDYKEAADLMDRMGERLDPAPFENVKAWAPLAVSQVRAMTGPHAKAIVAAEAQAEAGEYNAAAVALFRLSQKLGKDDPSSFFVRYREREMELEKDLLTGKWVSLAPGEDFLPWSVLSGDWKLEKDGSIVGTTDENGSALLACRHEFGTAYEVRATVDAPDGAKAGVANVYVERWQPRRWASGGVDFNRHTAHATGPRTRATQPLEGKQATVTVRVVNGQFGVVVNDKTVAADQRLDPSTPEEGAYVVLGMSLNRAVAPGKRVVRYRDVQVRRVQPGQN